MDKHATRWIRVSYQGRTADFHITQISNHRFQLSGSLMQTPQRHHTYRQCEKAAMQVMGSTVWPSIKTITAQATAAPAASVQRPVYASKRIGEWVDILAGSLVDQITEAVGSFKTKYNVAPSKVKVPKGASEININGLLIEASPAILPGKIWVGA